jgi:hypothetical protein
VSSPIVSFLHYPAPDERQTVLLLQGTNRSCAKNRRNCHLRQRSIANQFARISRHSNLRQRAGHRVIPARMDLIVSRA